MRGSGESARDQSRATTEKGTVMTLLRTMLAATIREERKREEATFRGRRLARDVRAERRLFQKLTQRRARDDKPSRDRADTSEPKEYALS